MTPSFKKTTITCKTLANSRETFYLFFLEESQKVFSKFKIEKPQYSTNTLFICSSNALHKEALKGNRQIKLLKLFNSKSMVANYRDHLFVISLFLSNISSLYPKNVYQCTTSTSTYLVYMYVTLNFKFKASTLRRVLIRAKHYIAHARYSNCSSSPSVVKKNYTIKYMPN